MTESEWLDPSETDPYREYLSRFSARKLRLFVCGCASLRPELLDERLSGAIAVVERVADSLELIEQLYHLRRRFKAGASERRSDHMFHALCNPDPAWAATSSIWHCAGAWASHQTRTVRIPSDEWRATYSRAKTEGYAHFWRLHLCVFHPNSEFTFLNSWRSEAAVALASAIYAERAFDRLPILADALQEAGCDDPTVLEHCCNSGPHARGCWVVDGVLGKQ